MLNVYVIILSGEIYYQARVVYYISGQKLLHYQAASLLYYQVMVLHYRAVITSTGDY